MPSLRLAVVCGSALAVALLAVSPEQAQARPQYRAAFAKKYENLKELEKEKKCGVCHFGESKKNNNDYGEAMKKALGEKNIKDEKKIDEALTAIEKEKSKVEGKTFGDLIKDGKLPGTDPEMK